MTAHCVRLSKPYSTDKALSFFFFYAYADPRWDWDGNSGSVLLLKDKQECGR